MLPKLNVQQTRLARTLACALLLLFATLQVQEAVHSHGVQDPAGQCLLCKGSADAAPGRVESSQALGLAVAAPPVERPRAAIAPAISHLFPRGPPTAS
jgi:hypothetical protein